jgi:hypothetical protein
VPWRPARTSRPLTMSSWSLVRSFWMTRCHQFRLRQLPMVQIQTWDAGGNDRGTRHPSPEAVD